MNQQHRLCTIGMADTCELFAQAFAFPTKELAAAMSSGAFQEDLSSCLADAGVTNTEPAPSARQALENLRGCDAGELFERLRVAYSLTYLAPGSRVPVWPYEAAFRHVKEGKGGVPTLFRAPVTVSVEHHMRSASVLPADSRTEPCDGIDKELAFLSFLLGNVAKAIQEENAEEERVWETRIRSFVGEHASRWMPDFFEASVGFEEAETYRSLALCAEPLARELIERYGEGEV